MASSQFGISERNATLVKKFQGNGWAVTCSPTSQRELSAIIGLAASVVKEPSEAPDPPELRLIHYQSDWADTVLERSLYWQPDNATAPLWVIKATENWDFALFQLPAPDRRWIVKFAGRILEPFSHRFLGWADLHEIIAHGFLLDQSMLVDGHLLELSWAVSPSVRCKAELCMYCSCRLVFRGTCEGAPALLFLPLAQVKNGHAWLTLSRMHGIHTLSVSFCVLPWGDYG